MIHTLSSVLIVYSWAVAAVLVFFLFLIGRFYEFRFGQRSYYQLFLVPLVLLIIGAVWDAFFANSYTGNPLLDFAGGFLPNLFFLIGGIVLTILCYALYRTMMRRRG
ncbi:MAG: hypothetical protein PVF77_10020 [Anaerolineae bacterium]